MARLFQQPLLAGESRSFTLCCIHFLPDYSLTFLAKIVVNSFAALQSAVLSSIKFILVSF